LAAPIGVAGLALGTMAVHLFGQAAPPTETTNLKFDVVSIKPSEAGGGRGRGFGPGPGGGLSMTGVTAEALMTLAYQVQPFQVIGAPGWFGTDRFDVQATADPAVAATPPTLDGRPAPLQLMLRGLLADWFMLAQHAETRDLPLYALVLARNDGRLGPALRPATAECVTRLAGRSAAAGPPSLDDDLPCGTTRVGPGNISGGATTMAQFAALLARWVNRTVVNKTGLSEAYQITLRWTPDQLPAGRGPLPPDGPIGAFDPNGPSIFSAVEEQLGLKLEAQRGPVNVIVIDHAERPTAN